MSLLKRSILDITVFVCGALVMVYEIIGSRILSPFIGASTYVWTSLIGIILAALSLGYWLGGRTADRRPDVRVLAFVILLAAGCVSATILVKDVVLAFISAAPIALELKAVAAAILLFAPASVALGFVTPYAVKLKMSSLADAGKTVGRLYALSTVGSIAGTFVAGFFLIPFVGSVRTLYIIAGSLIVISALLVPLSASRFTSTVITIFVLGIGGSEFTAYALRRANNLRDIDTEYSRVQVFDTVHAPTSRPIRVIATDPYFAQSAIFLDGEGLVLDYARFYHLIRHYRPGFRRSLLIGGAGYTFPREYLNTYPEATIDVVDIDPQMTAIARKYFGLQDDSRLRSFHEDGRVFLNQAAAGSYDVILMDAFGSLFSVPYQLTTLEAVREMHRTLSDDGIVIFNLGSAIRGDASLMLQAELKTYREVFPVVDAYKVRPDYPDEKLQNVIIVASKSQAAAESSDPKIAELLAHRYTADIPLTVPALTDDLAPVEYYGSIAQNVYLRDR